MKLPRRRRRRRRGYGSLPGIDSGSLKLDAKLTARFCKYVREGIAPETVAGLLRIHAATFWRWLQLGKVYAENGGKPEEYVVYFAFLQEYERARGVFLKRVTRELLREDASPKHVRRAIEVLRRRDPKQWSAPLSPKTEDIEHDYSPLEDIRYL